jgi:hypothetical protein
VLNQAKHASRFEDPVNRFREQGPFIAVNVMVDAYGCNEVERVVRKGQFSRRLLLLDRQRRGTSLSHFGGWVAADRSGKLAASQFE